MLPPHWTTNTPMAIVSIKKGMEMTSGTTINEHPDFVPILLRCFACIVFHGDKLIEQMTSRPGYDLNNLRILHNRELLNGLFLLVTTEPTEDVLTVPTGIPPHITQSRAMKNNLEYLIKIHNGQSSMIEDMKIAIHEEFERRLFDSGHVTNERLQAVLEGFERRNTIMIKDCITDEMGQIKGLLQQINNDGKGVVSTGAAAVPFVPVGSIVHIFS